MTKEEIKNLVNEVKEEEKRKRNEDYQNIGARSVQQYLSRKEKEKDPLLGAELNTGQKK